MVYYVNYQEYLTNPVQVKVGKVSSPTANVAQILEKVLENEKVCHGRWYISRKYQYTENAVNCFYFHQFIILLEMLNSLYFHQFYNHHLVLLCLHLFLGPWGAGGILDLFPLCSQFYGLKVMAVC